VCMIRVPNRSLQCCSHVCQQALHASIWCCLPHVRARGDFLQVKLSLLCWQQLQRLMHRTDWQQPGVHWPYGKSRTGTVAPSVAAAVAAA
jgi:hypothetical protein